MVSDLKYCCTLEYFVSLPLAFLRYRREGWRSRHNHLFDIGVQTYRQADKSAANSSKYFKGNRRTISVSCVVIKQSCSVLLCCCTTIQRKGAVLGRVYCGSMSSIRFAFVADRSGPTPVAPHESEFGVLSVGVGVGDYAVCSLLSCGAFVDPVGIGTARTLSLPGASTLLAVVSPSSQNMVRFCILCWESQQLQYSYNQ